MILYNNRRQLGQITRGAELKVLWSHPDSIEESALKSAMVKMREVGAYLQEICLLWFGWPSPSYLE